MLRRRIEIMSYYEEAIIILFPITVVVFATVFHEMFHVLALEIFGIYYEVNVSATWMGGVSIFIHPFSDITVEQATIVLSAGILGNFLVGLFFIITGWHFRTARKDYLTYLGLTAVGIAFVFSSAIYLVIGGGDIDAILGVLEVEVSQNLISLVGILIVLVSLLYFWVVLDKSEQDYVGNLQKMLTVTAAA